ncbi:hypothetical protein GBAR_LOCUS2873, partial [Geodia barretti]
MKSLIIITVLKATFSAVAVAVFLLPSPAHMAPSVHKRQVGPSASNTSVEAYNGLTVTLIYTETRPEFSSSMDNRDQSSVANSMCDLLAYHDTLATPP